MILLPFHAPVFVLLDDYFCIADDSSIYENSGDNAIPRCSREWSVIRFGWFAAKRGCLMQTLMRIGICYLAMTVMLPAALLADDLLNGTWELDSAASKFEPGPARKSDTRTYKVDGNNIHMIDKVVFADGKSINIEYTGAYDGKDYPVAGNPKVGMIAQERVDEYTAKTTTKRGGKITATSTRVISKDGKTMTITSTGTDEKGVAFNDTLVFHKKKIT